MTCFYYLSYDSILKLASNRMLWVSFFLHFSNGAKASRESSLKFTIRPICLPFPFPPTHTSLLPCCELFAVAKEWPMEISLPRRGAQSRETFQASSCLSNKDDKYLPSLDTPQVVLYSCFYFILYFRKQIFFPHEQVQTLLTFKTLFKDKD